MPGPSKLALSGLGPKDRLSGLGRYGKDPNLFWLTTSREEVGDSSPVFSSKLRPRLVTVGPAEVIPAFYVRRQDARQLPQESSESAPSFFALRSSLCSARSRFAQFHLALQPRQCRRLGADHPVPLRQHALHPAKREREQREQRSNTNAPPSNSPPLEVLSRAESHLTCQRFFLRESQLQD